MSLVQMSFLGIFLTLIGLILGAIGLVLIITHRNEERPWWMWALLIGGGILFVVGLFVWVIQGSAAKRVYAATQEYQVPVVTSVTTPVPVTTVSPTMTHVRTQQHVQERVYAETS